MAACRTRRADGRVRGPSGAVGSCCESVYDAPGEPPLGPLAEFSPANQSKILFKILYYFYITACNCSYNFTTTFNGILVLQFSLQN